MSEAENEIVETVEKQREYISETLYTTGGYSRVYSLHFTANSRRDLFRVTEVTRKDDYLKGLETIHENTLEETWDSSLSCWKTHLIRVKQVTRRVETPKSSKDGISSERETETKTKRKETTLNTEQVLEAYDKDNELVSKLWLILKDRKNAVTEQDIEAGLTKLSD